MSENIHESVSGVEIGAHIPDEYDAEATIDTLTFPDGTSRASQLSADELREVAATINDVADQMENADDE